MDKEKVWKWFVGLPLEECTLLLTDHNERETALLRSMYEKRELAGEGMYLPDEVNSGFLFRKLSTLETMVGGGAIIYPERVKQAERRLIENIRLCDTRAHLDSFTVATSVLEDREGFLHTLSVLSQNQFLSSPCHVKYDVANKSWKWESPKWFEEKGHYTLAEYLAAWLERLIWRRFFESTRTDPRIQTDRNRVYKPTQPNATLSTVLDPRKTRLKSFWCGLTEEERKKLAKLKMGSVMSSVVTSIEQTDRVDYFKMLKTLINLSLDQGTNGDSMFDDQLQKEPVKFIEFLYLTPLDRAGKVQDRVMRQVGASLQSVVADKLAMDLIESEESLKSKSDQHQQAKIRKKTPKKKKAAQPTAAQAKPSSNTNASHSTATSNTSGGNSNASSNTHNSNTNNTAVGKKKKKKKKGARGDGTMSANDAAQRDHTPTGKFGSRKHRHSLPLDFGQSSDIQKAIDDARGDDEDGGGAVVSDSEIHDGVAEDDTKFPVEREIVALDDSCIIEPSEDHELYAPDDFTLVRSRKPTEHKHGGKDKHEKETVVEREKHPVEIPKVRTEKKKEEILEKDKKKQEFISNALLKQGAKSNATHDQSHSSKAMSGQEQTSSRRPRNTSLSFPIDTDFTLQGGSTPSHELKDLPRPVTPQASPAIPAQTVPHTGNRSRANAGGTAVHVHAPNSPPLPRSLSSSAPHPSYSAATATKVYNTQYTPSVPRNPTPKITPPLSLPQHHREQVPSQQRTHYHRDHPVIAAHNTTPSPAKQSRVIQALSLPDRPPAALPPANSLQLPAPALSILDDTSSNRLHSPTLDRQDNSVPDWAGIYFPYSSFWPELTLQLHYEILDYVQYIGNQAREQQLLCQQAISRVSAVVTSIFPKSRVEVFGSFATGLWMPSSDIDLVILNVDYGIRGQIGRQSTQFLLQLLENELLYRGHTWLQSVQAIPLARVPVIKLIAKEGRVPIDITFSEFSTEHTGIAARNLVAHYVSTLPALVPLAVVLKTFLREHGLNNSFTGGLSSYCLVLMIISFLKQYYSACPPTGVTSETNNWGVLLIRFLEYYGIQFDYQRNGISITNDNFVFPLQYALPGQLSSFHPPYAQPPSTTIPAAVPALTDTSNPPPMENASVALPSTITHKSPSPSPNTSPLLGPQHTPVSSFIPTFQPPPLYVDDPINKGNNVGSHAFCMWRVRAAFSQAFETLTGSSTTPLSLLSKILNQRPFAEEPPTHSSVSTISPRAVPKPKEV